MTSPDHAFRLDLTPTPSSFHRWWRIDNNYGSGFWSATFNGDTPAEIVAGLTDGLIRSEPEQPAPSVADVLTGRGWQHTTSETGSQTLTSPDAIVQVQLYISPSLGVMGWEIEAAHHHGEYGPEQRIWRAHLDAATPPHLLAAVAEAISNPTPVLRARFKINDSAHLTQGPEFAIGAEVVGAHKQRLAEARRHRPKPRVTTTAPVTPPIPSIATPARPTR